MAKRKKVSEMTPYERVSQRMEGMSWEEVEEVGISILGTCLARRIYAFREDEICMKNLFMECVKKADEYARNQQPYLAWMSVARRLADEKKEQSPCESHQ